MIRLSVIFVVLASVHLTTTLADEHRLPRLLTGEVTPTVAAPALDDPTLFDFPISTALGIEIGAPPRPSIDHLATSADEVSVGAVDTIDAAKAPVVYYDAPSTHQQPRSIWR